MIYDLPTSVKIDGKDYEIRSDYRAVLDICTALSDPELTDQEKILVALSIFYPDLDEIPPDMLEQAVKKCFWFIDCGEISPQKKAPKLMDWEQDFKHIVAPINRVCGREIRLAEYMHWWTFVAFYHEIGGECLFAQIVRVRDHLARGKKLDKEDREWYRRNRELVDLKRPTTTEENELLKQWGGG
ncbi:hypothetical protein H8711_04110 [Clostridiaceae bacterium NSJ-31]|uniref:Bacteriophage Gp15 protein n=1 Tax=Ligaoa zhengdingensis TaxID=2763658 RepID=A0A926DY93_9FIRM|nr:Gp15 family bacteriophage protein [Ligaoa zhengdingensis]MBC8546118.1 hypothetical protein [Ligaoa zhengdingensis]